MKLRREKVHELESQLSEQIEVNTNSLVRFEYEKAQKLEKVQHERSELIQSLDKLNNEKIEMSKLLGQLSHAHRDLKARARQSESNSTSARNQVAFLQQQMDNVANQNVYINFQQV